ncbi:MAG: undecaprenyl-diphosphate phosphatase [Myxococcales bacterium]|nr:undecaprenyl-diphosphate phosphatase [Myxococcales bacterium]
MSPIVEAIVLGVLQGLTEFLPVSSSGHLALGQILMRMGEPSLTLSVVMHAGTLLATALLVRERLVGAVREGVRGLAEPKRFVETLGGRDVLVVVLASLPTAVIGLLMRGPVEKYTQSPIAIGLGFLGTAALLVSTLKARSGEADAPTWIGALLVGIAQGVAVLPGVSRSGSTIAVLLWLGVKPARAFELSMLMSLPAVLGAVLLESRHLESLHGLTPALIGAAVAFVFGVLALVLLRRVVIRNGFAWFALWVLPLGIYTLLFVKA